MIAVRRSFNEAEKPLFSIITISYNEEKRIGGTLKSVYEQSFRDFEHIIQDGISSDGTLGFIEKVYDKYEAGQLKVYSEKDNGLYDAMNKAIKKATGEYICFINCGDYLYDSATLQKVAEHIEACPGVDWYYGGSIVIFPNGDEYLQIQSEFENIEGADISNILREKGLGLIHQSIFAHKKCFDDNLFDIGLKLRAELKWYYSCLFSDIKVKKLNFPVSKYSYGGISERVENAELNIIETKHIYEVFGISCLNQYLPKENDYSENCKTIYNMWLALYQAGLSLRDYLRSAGIKRVAIYGYGELGCHLINELYETDIEIACIIDRKEKYSYRNIMLVKPDDFCENVDMVIVTAVGHYVEIREHMNRITKCKIVSLQDILEAAW